MLQSVGALLYFYGDNINEAMETYGEDFGCKEQCLINNRIAATISLPLAFIIIQYSPMLFQWEEEYQEDMTIWYHALRLVVTITKIDVLYTTILITTQTDEFCGHIDVKLSISFTVICILLAASVLGKWCYLLAEEGGVCVFACIWMSLMGGFTLFILGDNSQPLDCQFGCDFSASNQTLNELSCDEIGVAKLKFGLITSSGVLIFITVLVLILKDLCSCAA